MNKEFNIAFIGDSKVGKTTFITRHHTGEFMAEYCPSMEIKVYPLSFDTSEGRILLNCWDGKVPEEEEVDAVVAMFDVTNRLSYENVEGLIRGLNVSVPIILCGNKVDCCRDRQIHPQKINLHRELKLNAYYDISARSNYNFEKPFLKLIRTLMRNQHIRFLD